MRNAILGVLVLLAVACPPAGAAVAVDDTTPPVVGIHEPLSGAVLNHAYPSLNGPAGAEPGDEAVVTLELFAGDVVTGTPASTKQVQVYSGGGWGIISLHVPDGRWTLRVSQRDAAGNTGTATVSFWMDTKWPWVTVHAPKSDTVVESVNPTFAGEASTGEGDADTVTVQVFAGQPATGAPLHAWELPVVDGSWTVTPDVSFADGLYTLAVTQADRADHQYIQHVLFAVDTVAPAPTVSSPAEAVTSAADLAGAAGTARGDASRVQVELFDGSAAQGQPRLAREVAVVKGQWTVRLAEPLPPGTYTLRVRQSDWGGHVGSAARTFVVAAATPVPTVQSPVEEATPPPAAPRDTTAPTVRLPARVTMRNGRLVIPLVIGEFATGSVSVRLGKLLLAHGTFSRGGHVSVRLRPRRGALARLRRARRRPTIHVRVADAAGNVTSRRRAVGVR